jgi:hypothetical protein
MQGSPGGPKKMFQRIKLGLKNFIGALREITPLLELADAIVTLVMHVMALLTALHVHISWLLH